MASARKIMHSDPAFILVLDADEAGYLRALLYSHTGGGLTTSAKPLGRILDALTEACVPSRYIRNLNAEAPQNERLMYTVAYDVNDTDADEGKWWVRVPHDEDVSYLFDKTTEVGDNHSLEDDDPFGDRYRTNELTGKDFTNGYK